MSSIVQRQVWLSAMTAAFIGPRISAYFYEANGQYTLGFAGAAILAADAICLVLLTKKSVNSK